MKALEILRRELQNNYEKRPFVIKTELYHKERIEDFHEAIAELEALQNRSCEGCKFGKFGVDSLGIEVECLLIWKCSRGYKDNFEIKDK